MGDGSIAGGSGGEYFVGTFDGKRFQCDHDLGSSQWVDFGRDFYAPVSWSDIPANDGRRIWIGWMNNWETCLVPTRPWRSAMSIPRCLSLRRVDDRLKLVQTPVEELKTIRGRLTRLEGMRLGSGETSLTDEGITGDRLEIMATFEVGNAKEVGLIVRKGADEQTVIGYDVLKQELFVDRRQSGNTAFHPSFAGRHAGPLKAMNGRITLRVFVDTSSVEVFGNEGTTVLTERIFPHPKSHSVAVYAKGGTATLPNLQAWQLKSIW